MNEVKTYRLNQLTRELGVTFAELQELLKTNGIKVNTPNDRVTEEAFQIIKEYYNLDIDKDTNIKKDKDTSIEEDQNTKIEEVKKITEKEIKTDLKTEPLQQDTKSFEFNIKVKGKIDLDEEVDKATKEKPSTTSKQKIKEDKIQPKEQQHTIADTKQKEQATEELITKKYTKEELSETESKTKIASEAIKHTPVNEEEPSIIDKKVEKPYLQEINLKVKYKIDLDEVEPKREKSKQNGKNQARPRKKTMKKVAEADTKGGKKWDKNSPDVTTKEKPKQKYYDNKQSDNKLNQKHTTTKKDRPQKKIW